MGKEVSNIVPCSGRIKTIRNKVSRVSHRTPLSGLAEFPTVQETF